MRTVQTLYQRLKEGREGGMEFGPLVDMLLLADSREHGCPFTTFDDDMGDAFGVDSFRGAGPGNTGGLIGFRYRFSPSPLWREERESVRASLERAIEHFPDLEKWVLITPEDLVSKDAQWFGRLGRQFGAQSLPGPESGGRTVLLEHWGHSRIMKLMLRYPHIAENYFPDLVID